MSPDDSSLPFNAVCPVGRSLWTRCRFSRPSEPFALSLLDRLQVRLHRLYMRETPAGFWSQTPRNGIHESSELNEDTASHVPNLRCVCTRSYCAVFQRIMSEGPRHREGGGGVRMNRKRFSTESELITLIGGAAREVLVGENSELITQNFEPRVSRGYFRGEADMRSHSATPLRPTCLSKAARMRRKEGSC